MPKLYLIEHLINAATILFGALIGYSIVRRKVAARPVRGSQERFLRTFQGRPVMLFLFLWSFAFLANSLFFDSVATPRQFFQDYYSRYSISLVFAIFMFIMCRDRARHLEPKVPSNE